MTDRVLFEGTLEELLSGAERAAPNDRVSLYRDPIAAYGSAAIDRLVPWLEHPRLVSFAATTIRRSAEFGAKKHAIAALRQSLGNANDGNRDFLREQLQLLGVIPDVEVTLPAGLKLTPAKGKVKVNHVVVDKVVDSGTRWGAVYLVECGYWFGVSWVGDAGGLISGPSSNGCMRCKQALEAA